MKLAHYLSENGISYGEFARRIDACNARTVQRYCKHGRIPSGRMMAVISRATGGAVTPNDFIDDCGN